MKRVNLQSLRGEAREFFINLRPEDESVVVEDDGRPIAAVVPPWQADRWEENRRKLFALIRQAREANRGVPGATIEADIAATIEEIRRQSA